jgi:predicted enzyme related to lactoylglutathione lyase
MSKHPIVHIEIPAKDLTTAAKFYAEMFDWKTQHDPKLNYTMFENSGVGGGFNPVSEEMQIGPGDILLHVATDDIEAHLAKAEKLGGKTLVPKTEIPGIGWFGIFTDPTGNRIGLYTALNPS